MLILLLQFDMLVLLLQYVSITDNILFDSGSSMT